jgi:hypothetical protein
MGHPDALRAKLRQHFRYVQEPGSHIRRQQQQFGFGLGYQLDMPRH